MIRTRWTRKSLRFLLRSQEVEPGGLFVAITGHQADGHDYIEDASARGSSGHLARITGSGLNLRSCTARRWRTWRPAFTSGRQNMMIIGITGTNGKTTTAYLVESILASAGFQVGVIGTIDYRYGGRSFDNPVTTPESLDLERILSEMSDAGVTHAVVEVSSHAIALGRIRNLGSMWLSSPISARTIWIFMAICRSYGACKKSLFTQHLPRGPKADRTVAVINCSNRTRSGAGAGSTEQQ